jgi:hypothetical protein
VVIVHPDEISGLVCFENGGGKGGVDSLVGWPVLVGGGVLGGDILPEKVVEEWPKRCGVRAYQSVRSKMRSTILEDRGRSACKRREEKQTGGRAKIGRDSGTERRIDVASTQEIRA